MPGPADRRMIAKQMNWTDKGVYKWFLKYNRLPESAEQVISPLQTEHLSVPTMNVPPVSPFSTEELTMLPFEEEERYE